MFQRYGGAFVDGLDEQIGELTARQARSVAAAGQVEVAKRLFEDALSAGFLHPEQRSFCIQDFATLLIDEAEYDRALEWIEEGAEAAPNDGKLAYLRFRALEASGEPDAALAAATVWYDIGSASGDSDVMRAAKFAEATVHRSAGRHEEALQAFLRAHELRPGSDTALRAGRLYLQLGRPSEARTMLEYAAASASGDAQAAKELLSDLPE